MKDKFDVIIVGGSYAGLSAAMALGRSMRDVLVIDSGDPCNKQTPHSHNFLTQDGKPPGEIAAIAREQVSVYDHVSFYTGLAISGTRSGGGFEITVESGESFKAKKLIFATGISDQMPDIKGFSECWGISVIHCPYCHGYEFRNKKTSIMADGEWAVHLASLVHNLTKDVTIFTQGVASIEKAQLDLLVKNGIRIINTEITEIVHSDGSVKSVILEDRQEIILDALYASIPFSQKTNIPTSLGCELDDHGYIIIDNMQKTTVNGVYACGDNCSPLRSVANAVAGGNMAGAKVNMELVEESF